MALGFGFNKAKVLSSAEKFVQQGKLQNAIAEYEKVIKEDPKDLTVLNAIGDLHARVGQNEKAAEYFKNVGDQYAHNGFTVKAIAVYKKLTRLSTSADAIVKLAELYTQQGLFNDARAHYMQVADQLLKSGNNEQAAKIFQKILELDPENTATQSKLADLYIKLGKKEEARNIYFSAAESLYSRSSFDAADEALSRVLSLDPENSKALLLRGMIASESGDTAAAVQYLDQVPDIDSHPDALRALLRAKLQAGSAEGAEGLAIKLLTVHHDASGISSLTEWMVAHQHVEQALKLYDQYADRLLSGGQGSLLETLYPLINRIRNNPQALGRMLRLLQKAGDSSHQNEVTELLAHAHVQAGNFEEARDLYKQLSEVEPENPLHTQNYKQMLAKLGEDPMNRPLSEQESTQALMVEELEQSAPTIQQEYSPTVEKAIEAALTDAELFVSYNVPLKAIAPLEAVLPVAPRDLHVNHRLASLYIRAARFADAAQTCKLLSEIYAEFGHKAEAERYAEEAQKYSERAGVEVAKPAAPAAATPVEALPAQPEPPAPSATSTVQEFVLDVPGEFFETPAAESAPVMEETPAAEGSVSGFGFEVEPETPPEPARAPIPEPAKTAPPAPSRAAVTPEEIEIDVSHEWEHMLSVEPETAASAPAVPELTVEPPAPSEPVMPVSEAIPAGPDPALIEDKVQEIRFYISQKFWDMAQTAIHDLAELTPDNPQLAELKAAVAAGQAEAAAAAKAATAPPVAPAPQPAKAAPEPVPDIRPEPPQAKAPAVPEKPHKEEKQEKKKKAEEEFVLDLDEQPSPLAAQDADVLSIEPPPPPPPPPPAKPVPATAVKAPEPSEDVLNEMVLDLEESLGDFVPVEEESTSAPPPPVTSAPAAKPAPAASIPKTPSPRSVPVAASATSNGGMRDSESASVLSDILSELQEDLGEEAVEAEDPETHYNLGIAFKEMGLLDEAIGELQKVCHALEHGNSFTQPVQAYTWLAQCLVDKGVPEAAVRWYEKALTLPGLDHTSRCAIYYDLGSAYEASGDKKAALANFMEVYSSNIDFRDVATRIKTLKS